MGNNGLIPATYKNDNNPTGIGYGNIIITGNLVYNTPGSDELGLVAQNSVSILSPIAGTGRATDGTQGITIDAGLTGQNGIFMSNEWWAGSYRGNLNNVGALNNFTQTLNGTFNPNSGTIASGYNEVYTYDSHLANSPPPDSSLLPCTLMAVCDLGANK